MKFLWEQDKVKIWQDYENGCIPLHSGTHTGGWRSNVSDVLVIQVIIYVITFNDSEKHVVVNVMCQASSSKP